MKSLFGHSLAASFAPAFAGASFMEFGRKETPDPDDVLEGHIKAVEAKLDGFDDELKVFKAIVAELEQKAARSGGADRAGFAGKSLGRALVEGHETELDALAKNRGRVNLQTKAIITSATTNADGSAGSFLQPFVDGPAQMPRRRVLIRDLLPVIRVTTGTVEYPKQTGRTINAATVAEGSLKPQSEMKFSLESVPIRTIAHWVLASKQILADAGQVVGVIDGELRYGLEIIEDFNLLNGAGVGTDINGLYTQATAFSPPVTVPAANKLDVIGLAMLQSALAGFPPDGVVIHPSDWWSIRLLKNADGDYIMGPPAIDIEPRLFGKPVAVTEAMTVDKFLVGDFADAGTLYDREEAHVEISTEDSDNFRKNLVTILAEERVGLAVKQATALTKGDFSDAITAATTAP